MELDPRVHATLLHLSKGLRVLKALQDVDEACHSAGHAALGDGAHYQDIGVAVSPCLIPGDGPEYDHTDEVVFELRFKQLQQLG